MEHSVLTRPDKTGGASFSNCGRYRYKLWRKFDEGSGTVLFIMLNPSTADELKNDPTVERCERRARGMKYAQMVVCNIFALRSTSPKALTKKGSEPIGEDNDRVILKEAKRADLVICAWGTHGKILKRGKYVHNMLLENEIELYVLMMNKSGDPKHPLYIRSDLSPIRWR